MTTTDLARHLIDELQPVLGAGEAASVARLVLEDLFGTRRGSRPRALTQDEQLLAWTTINRLKAGEPVQYVTGIADFYGLQLTVSPAVLIPRPETEELVEWILADHGEGTLRRVLDAGTGSGCISLALSARRPAWRLTGMDVSADALAVARGNAERLGLAVAFVPGDALQLTSASTIESGLADASPAVAPKEGGINGYDIIVSNPPYIPPSERDRMGASTLAHEPDLALFAPEDDPLVFYRRIAEAAKTQLRTGGQLYFETNEFNHNKVVELLRSTGWTDVQSRKDLQGKRRMIRAERS